MLCDISHTEGALLSQASEKTSLILQFLRFNPLLNQIHKLREEK